MVKDYANTSESGSAICFTQVKLLEYLLLKKPKHSKMSFFPHIDVNCLHVTFLIILCLFED